MGSLLLAEAPVVNSHQAVVTRKSTCKTRVYTSFTCHIHPMWSLLLTEAPVVNSHQAAVTRRSTCKTRVYTSFTCSATFTRWGPCSWQKRQLSTPTRQRSRGGQHVRDECTRPSHATFTRWGPCSWQKPQLSTPTRQRSRGGQHVRDECTRPSHVLPHSPDVVPAPGRSASCQLPPGSGHEEVNM